MDGWMDRSIDGRIDGSVNGSIDGSIDRLQLFQRNIRLEKDAADDDVTNTRHEINLPQRCLISWLWDCEVHVCFRGTDTLPREVCRNSEKGSTLKGKNLFPFS